MLGRLLIAASLVYACYCTQCWSTTKRAERRRLKREDLPRWEGEGGSPAPEPDADSGLNNPAQRV